eukprot:22044-Pelagomonas_calceolata.AAC.1
MMVVHTPGESGNCITEATSKSIIASAMLPQRGGGPNDSNGGSSGGDGGGSNGGGGSSEGKGDGGGGQGHPMQLWTYLYAALLGGYLGLKCHAAPLLRIEEKNRYEWESGGYGWHLFDLEWPPPGKRSRLKYNHYSPTCPDVKNECWAV